MGKREFVWTYGSRSLESMMLEQTQGNDSRKLKAYILNHKQETERELEMAGSFKCSKATCSPHLLCLPNQCH